MAQLPEVSGLGDSPSRPLPPMPQMPKLPPSIQAAFQELEAPSQEADSPEVKPEGAAEVQTLDPHKILGVEPGATFDECKKAFKAIARLYHPDVCQDAEGQKKFWAASTAIEVIRAKTTAAAEANQNLLTSIDRIVLTKTSGYIVKLPDFKAQTFVLWFRHKDVTQLLRKSGFTTWKTDCKHAYDHWVTHGEHLWDEASGRVVQVVCLKDKNGYTFIIG